MVPFYIFVHKTYYSLFDEMFSQQLQTTPLYTKDTTENLAQYLHDMLCDGEGETIAEALSNAECKFDDGPE